MKINISLDDELVKRIETYADNNYMSRSGFISLACNQYLASADVVTAIKSLSLALNKIADNGDIDEETKKQLDDYKRLADLLAQGR
jgi:metal-responsive CopG/Arc/MetJ family transcriptional regulator